MAAIDASTNPEVAQNALAALAAINAGGSPTSDPGLPDAIEDVPDTQVLLPGGVLQPDGSVIRSAEVRELTGFDEEALSKTTTVGKFVEVLLERGVVEIAGQPADKDVLDQTLSGDLDALLLAIRAITFGKEYKASYTCPGCEHAQDVVFDLTVDVPTTVLPDAERWFDITLKSGKTVSLTLPTGKTQKVIAASTDRSDGTLNTLLLTQCVQRIEGFPSLGARTVQALGMRDRREILEVLSERNPGPRLSEVSRSCAECSRVNPLPLTLTDLFLG